MYERKYAAKVLSTQKGLPKEKVPKHPFPLKKFLWGTAIALLVAGAVIAVRHPALQVKTIDVIGTETIDQEDIATFVRESIDGTFLHFFPRSSIFVVSTGKLERAITVAFPRAANVQVTHEGVDGLSVHLLERTEAYLWCVSDESCFFMTKEGIVFARAPFFSGDAYERIFWGEDAGTLPFSPVPTEILTLFEKFRTGLPPLGIVPVEYHFVSDHRVDISFFHHGSIAQLIVDQTLDPEQVMRGLASALDAEPLQSDMKTNSKFLEYLDARFPNKIIYKFK
ncbi:hypothetical protein IT401_01230 [Candidatus Nomurabacteria bacterium]|nr:hypothetical protein [Candidatus Nomurabacteria bacterium]